MDENARSAAPRDADAVMRERARRLGARQRAARRGARPRARSHRAVVQGVERAGPDRRLPRARARAAITRCISGSPRRAWAARASSRRPRRWRCCCRKASATRSASRSRRSPTATARKEVHRRAGDPADDGAALVHADGDRVSRLRPHDQHLLPGARATASRRYLRASMPAWRAQYPGVETMHGRGDGLRRQRPGRIEAREHRHHRCPAPAKRRSRRCTSTARRP